MGSFSIWHLLVVAVIVLIFFGPTKIEGLGKALGRSIRGFKEGLNEIDSNAREVTKDETSGPRQELGARSRQEGLSDNLDATAKRQQESPDKRNI